MFAEAAPMNFTDNEVNNLIYILTKFGFRKIQSNLSNPPNSLIKNIMLDVADNPTVENIINQTARTVIEEYNIYLKDSQIEALKDHMSLITRMFMSEPFSIRNDLGEDSEADEFITKH